MKKQGQLVTLPSIPTASDAFAPPKLRHPSTYSPTEPVMFVTACPGGHPPHCWLPLPKNNVILSALQLHHSSSNIRPFPDQSTLMLTLQKSEN
jgi:hypothetical protein